MVHAMGKRPTAGVLATLLAASAPAPAAPEGAARYGQVILADGTALHVELAESPRQRRLGYMFRDGVGPEDGMLFLFQDEEFHPFWMKNVRFPLDILWLSGDGEIVDLALETPPCTKDPCPSYAPLARARYTLELAGGRARALGLERGARLQVLVPDPEPAPARP